MLSVDMILRALIGNKEQIEQLLIPARKGECYFLILDFALYAALHSVDKNDKINVPQFAELMRYSYIEPDNARDMGISGRECWTPSPGDVQHWRTVALDVAESDV